MKEYLSIYGVDDNKGGYVYCLMDEVHNMCKIGMSADETKRVKSLKSQNPVELTHEIVPVKDRVEAENYLHRFFHNRRKHGEWFSNVSFEEFFRAVLEYKLKKENQYLDSVAFYKFLYDTECEYVKGIPKKVWEKLRCKDINILVIVDSKFKDRQMFRDKMDYMLSNLFDNSNITLIFAKGWNDEWIYSYCEYKNTYSIGKDIQKYSFYPNYNYKGGYNDSCLSNFINAINMCYGVIVFSVRTSILYTKILNHAKLKNVKTRVILSDNQTGYGKNKHVVKLKYA